MTRRRLIVIAGSLVAACVLAVSIGTSTGAGSGSLPAKLSDKEFWTLIADLSEADGYFRSDNLLSNEIWLQHVIPELTRVARPGRVYLGVGPEQNFTYIAALKPAMAFIVDVRRGNMQLHLMYKALFEMSRDRADFLSRLFSKKRPDALSPAASPQDLVAAFAKVETDETLYRQNLKDIQDHLVRKRHMSLTEDDRKGIEYVYYQFYWYGPVIQYWSTGGRGGRNAPTYADLMLADDGKGQARSFLASEENFAVVKELHARNLLVPVIGNFAGPKALRSVAKYVRDRGGSVSAFYLSNVEQYLGREGVWSQFCANAATLPLDESSTFIRSVRNGTYAPGVGLDNELGNIATEVRNCGSSPGGWMSHLEYLLRGQRPPVPPRPAYPWRR